MNDIFRKARPMGRLAFCFVVILFPLAASAQEGEGLSAGATVPDGEGELPPTLWEKVPGSTLWTRAALASLKDHAEPLTLTVPRDIADWCPAYPQASQTARRAFWVGLLSTIAKHESTFRPAAVGGGGKWFGLMQIMPSTARSHGCRARNAEALRQGPENLSCALRIMTRSVQRDGVIAQGMRGVAAHWGPFHNASKRDDMKQWLRSQGYCKPISATRPKARPRVFAEAAN